MAARTTTTGAPSISGRTIAGIIVQVFSFLATYGFVVAIGLESYLGFAVAVSVEVALFYGKKLIFEHRNDSAGWACIAIDTLLNAGGIYPYASKGSATPTWLMLSDALGLQPTMSKSAALVLALLLGFVLSFLPHRLFYASQKGNDDAR